jgi:hypothetical protein
MLVNIDLQLVLRCMHESVRVQRKRPSTKQSFKIHFVPLVSCPWSPPLWVFQIVILSMEKAAIEKKSSVVVHVSYYRGEARDLDGAFHGVRPATCLYRSWLLEQYS